MAGARDENAASGRTGGAGSPKAAKNGSSSHDGPILIDVDLVQRLIDAVDNSGIDTLEISRAGTRIRISKTPAVTVASAAAAPPSPAAAPAAAAPAAPAAAPAEAEPASPNKNWVEVKSPMVGTFYRAPAPEAPPYVEVGSTVSKGQTLCILEAMKLMNELESEVEGVVREVHAENADPVEYGQVLFRIEPQGSS
jgi:acetyl-CoA carboxylase biotin carboxyl carrier protein